MKKGLNIVIFLLFLFLPVFVFASGSVTVSSTSSKDTSNIKELAVDGNLNTRWSSNRGSNDEWIYVDLGKTATLDAVKVQWQEACSHHWPQT